MNSCRKKRSCSTDATKGNYSLKKIAISKIDKYLNGSIPRERSATMGPHRLSLLMFLESADQP